MTDLAARLAEDERAGSHPYRRPLDAATLLIVDRSGPEPRLLMGRRHERHVFMPGKFVFPGGRVDPSDARVPIAEPLDAAVAERLTLGLRRGSGARARGLAVAALREAYEEAGVIVGRPSPAAARLGAGWNGYRERELAPDLSGLRYVARAVTPTGRPRRFDARFFMLDAASVTAILPEGVGPSGELAALAWPTLGEAFALDLPLITRTILDDLREALCAPAAPAPGAPVPFYVTRARRFVRELL